MRILIRFRQSCFTPPQIGSLEFGARPVRHPINFSLAIALSILTTSTLVAQSPRRGPAGDSSNRRNVSSHAERTARASWTPTRSGERTVSLPTNEPQDESQERQGRVAPIALVDHTEIMPMREHVIEQPIIRNSSLPVAMPPSIVHGPMDGQIMDGNIVHGDVIYDHGGSACDSLPGGCGCSDSSCDGGCGFESSCGLEPACGCDDGSCDSIGGGGCCSMCGELASPNAWKPYVTISLPQDGWASFEYLGYWQDGLDLPALVTTSPAGTSQANAGVLGAPGTDVLFGGDDVLDGGIDGGRLNVGIWLNKRHTIGVGGDFFRIGTESESFFANSSGSPILARPFVNLTGNGGGAINDSELVAFPGVLAGSVGVRAESRLTGAGFDFRFLRGCEQGCGRGIGSSCREKVCSRSELLLGYRFLDLREGVFFDPGERLTAADGSGSFAIDEAFETRNQFNGFNIGWQYRRNRGFWTFDSRIRLAFGNNRQTARIRGTTEITDATGTNAFEGGLLAQRSNIGTFRQDEFAISPEIYVGLGYQLTERFRAIIGYNFLYLSNVIRPGGIIDTDLNTGLLPPEDPNISGVLRPEFAFDTTDYWAQGISIGGEYRW